MWGKRGLVAVEQIKSVAAKLKCYARTEWRAVMPAMIS